ncbi:hypothetical protein P869_09575 [Ligilactobacillus ruminis S23]|uniref:hypothetical protein n=1 Tax=Ligilactobacillus ruminis TaxID=1623 RepID=UPI00062F881E|nr:hypothetical protein [Ligilactobacillus ruminis]KLA46453.1 hypothetical protein P869_09575 [Ligilactobacillus ruminis S23]
MNGFYGHISKIDVLSVTSHCRVPLKVDKIRGKRFLDKNPLHVRLYPTEEKRWFLTVFQLYDGIGEWYDLSILPAKSGTFKVARN